MGSLWRLVDPMVGSVGVDAGVVPSAANCWREDNDDGTDSAEGLAAVLIESSWWWWWWCVSIAAAMKLVVAVGDARAPLLYR